MPRPADQPESNSTLPLPELNPLVNPLLGQNMGRWAEVYFTSPPEKREEAVLNLLRELEDEASRVPNNSASETPEIPNADASLREHPAQAFASAGVTQETKRHFISCQSCGANNAVQQRFCGQCGRPLRTEPMETGRAKHIPPSQAPALNQSFFSPESAPALFSYEGTRYGGANISAEPEHGSETSFASSYPRELQWERDVEAPKLLPEYAPVAYRYRIYVGAAIALLISALVYVAWRGGQVSSENSPALPQAPVAANTQPSAPSQAPMAESSARNGSQDGKTNVAPAPGNRAANQPPSSGPVHTSDATGLKKASDLAPVPPSAPAQTPAATSLPDNGSRELAVAQSYLNNSQGKVRDSSEAAKWLWQAVRKENASAALILSDLYLRGDGVPKSCDQGRLLLNAAGRRGVPGAGERIRNLQAFGCQ